MESRGGSALCFTHSGSAGAIYRDLSLREIYTFPVGQNMCLDRVRLCLCMCVCELHRKQSARQPGARQ